MRLHHVQITMVEGRESEARGYYEGLLGLKWIPKPAALPRPGLWFDGEGCQVHLGPAEKPPESGRAHAAFTVRDFDGLRARIAGADFEVRDAEPLAGARRFHTRDPFGNRLEFIEETNDAPER